MNTNTETVKDQTPKDTAAKARRKSAAKVEKPAKANGESGDRLPKTVEELKASKGGLTAFLFLSGKKPEEISGELAAAFKLSAGHAAKITRRITGRARFFQRVTELMAVK